MASVAQADPQGQAPGQAPGQQWPNINRVKVYKLSDDNGTWTDRGTGFINVEYMEVRVHPVS